MGVVGISAPVSEVRAADGQVGIGRRQGDWRSHVWVSRAQIALEAGSAFAGHPGPVVGQQPGKRLSMSKLKLAWATAALMLLIGGALLYSSSPGGTDRDDGSDSGTLVSSARSTFSRGGCHATSMARTHNGEITVFVGYSPANGGTNCAFAVKRDGYTVAQDLHVALHVCEDDPGEVQYRQDCSNRSASEPGNAQWDGGSFYHYAGPVFRTNTSGRCIYVQVYYQRSWRRTVNNRCG
jgi:hypothetical protein